MILRRRHPDGTNHDIDMGPGPVGRMSMPGKPRYIGAMPVALSAEPPPRKLGLTVARNRRFRERHG